LHQAGTYGIRVSKTTAAINFLYLLSQPPSPLSAHHTPPRDLRAGDLKMVQRLTYRKRHSYATKSNQHRVVKTPGQ